MAEKSRVQPPMSPITDVLADLQATSRWQERVYKQLHAHPELSFQETETAALAASKLKELGYEVLEGIGRTGVVGVLRNGEGQTVLARADMDALPVKENTGLPYASTLTASDAGRANRQRRARLRPRRARDVSAGRGGTARQGAGVVGRHLHRVVPTRGRGRGRREGDGRGRLARADSETGCRILAARAGLPSGNNRHSGRSRPLRRGQHSHHPARQRVTRLDAP